ncbi:MAG: outer membrane protein assembly factor BamE [Gemmatimonadota bacterium]
MGTVTEGMSMQQVLDAWGTPNVKVREGSGERWSYWFRDDRQRVVGKTYVWFDDRRRVAEVRTTPEPRTPQEPKRPVTITLGGALGALS